MRKRIHPARAVALVFLLAILAGTLLLMLPAARVAAGAAPWNVALFTAVSAICVTGMAIVDTGTYWSPFGQVAIMVLFQLGGIGLMTAATLLGLMVNRSPKLRTRMLTHAESRTLGMGDVTNVLRIVIIVTAVWPAPTTRRWPSRTCVRATASPSSASSAPTRISSMPCPIPASCRPTS